MIPLRSVRRALKSPPALVEASTAEAFRNRIKAVELEAERLQQEAMYALAPLGAEATDPNEAARANVAAYEAMLACGSRRVPPRRCSPRLRRCRRSDRCVHEFLARN